MGRLDERQRLGQIVLTSESHQAGDRTPVGAEASDGEIVPVRMAGTREGREIQEFRCVKASVSVGRSGSSGQRTEGDCL